MKGKTELARITRAVAVEVVGEGVEDTTRRQRERHLGHRRVRTKRL